MRYTLLLGGSEWLGEQRLRLTIDGEQIVDVDYRTPSDPPAPLSGRGPIGMLIAQAATRCDTCSFAYALSFCQACEALLEQPVPALAGRVRVGLAELERLAAHLGNLHKVIGALGLSSDADHLAAMARELHTARRELVADQPANLLAIGGLAQLPKQATLTTACTKVSEIGRRLLSFTDRNIDRRTLVSRTVGVGALSDEAVKGFGLRGPLARATGIMADTRADAPYAAYADLTPNVVVQQGGDVYARLVVLLLEALESARMIEATLSELPGGLWQGEERVSLPNGTAEASVEAPRGPLLCRIEQAANGITAHFRPAAPFDRLLARALLSGAHLDDAALIVSSANHCSGCAGAANL